MTLWCHKSLSFSCHFSLVGLKFQLISNHPRAAICIIIRFSHAHAFYAHTQIFFHFQIFVQSYPLGYCCYVRQAVKYINCGAKRILTTCQQKRQSRLLLIVFLKKFKQLNKILWLFNVLCPISTAPQFKQQVKRSSLHIDIKHEINLNNRRYFISTLERHQCTPFFKFDSTYINLLSCLICLSDKMANQRYDWSDRPSIKLSAKGQLVVIGFFINIL